MTSYASHTATFYTSKHGFVHFTNSHVVQVNKRLSTLYLQPSFTRHKMTSYTSSTAKLYTSKNDFIHFTNSQVVQVKNDFVHFTLSHVLHVKKRLRTLPLKPSFTRQKTTSYTSHTAEIYRLQNDSHHFNDSQNLKIKMQLL